MELGEPAGENATPPANATAVSNKSLFISDQESQKSGTIFIKIWQTSLLVEE